MPAALPGVAEDYRPPSRHGSEPIQRSYCPVNPGLTPREVNTLLQCYIAAAT